jgi:hypothetical protein
MMLLVALLGDHGFGRSPKRVLIAVNAGSHQLSQ